MPNSGATSLKPASKKILLGQLAAFGDVLFATAIARQIKTDFPESHLTWAIARSAAPLLAHNPHIDEMRLYEYDATKASAHWAEFKSDVVRMIFSGQYDAVYLTQIHPDNYRNFDGTVRQSIFRGYPNPITVSTSPEVNLSCDEVDRVRAFIDRNAIKSTDFVVVFEFQSNSGQSFVNKQFAHKFVELFLARFKDAKIIVTSNEKFGYSDPRLADASELTFRENAELSRYATLLVGVSSGISWLFTATWAASVPMIQLLSEKTSVYASFVHDFEYLGQDSSRFIELNECDPVVVVDCISTFRRRGFAAARRLFHKSMSISFSYWGAVMWRRLLSRGQLEEFEHAVVCTSSRYGKTSELVQVVANLMKLYQQQRK